MGDTIVRTGEVVVEKPTANAKLKCDYKLCNEEYPCDFTDYEYSDNEYFLEVELNTCLDELETLSEEVAEVAEIVEEECITEVDINDGKPVEKTDNNRYSSYYTACQKLGLFCDLL